MIRELDKPYIAQLPGRGLVTAGAIAQRIKFLNEHGISTRTLEKSNVDIQYIQNNIENYIGAVEIPVGVAGPLLFRNGDEEELLFVPAGTLEGALIASMSRGARAISASGGFVAEVKWQRMLRAPLFVFEREAEAEFFESISNSWLQRLQDFVSGWSNHAKLIGLDSVRTGCGVHLRFIYTTCDASGQNMTTSCTWHAIQFICDLLKNEFGIVPQKAIIDGNGSSDKKVSAYTRYNGRGISVKASCILREEVIRSVLRTTSADVLTCVYYAKQIAALDGMFTFNINVSNAIAAIFVATGQDLGSLHESGNGIFHAELVSEGLLISVELPNLVIGTVGGGTLVPKQNEALNMIGCNGAGKVERFASIIAGAVLGLEISTCSAIASGEFAKAHEKLGRNKPVKWLVRSDLKPAFFHSFLLSEYQHYDLSLQQQSSTDNGILTSIAARTSRKVIGFQSLLLSKNQTTNLPLIAKIKATDSEVIKGLHTMAASIDPELSDLIKEYAAKLEYRDCHLKEVILCQLISESSFNSVPGFYGSTVNSEREIFILLQEYLQPEDMLLMNSENDPQCWTEALITDAITEITRFHRFDFYEKMIGSSVISDLHFKPWTANSLYNKLIDLLIREEASPDLRERWASLINGARRLESQQPDLPRVLIHNDFNARNVGVRRNNKIVIYDWELAVWNYPHRDVVEFLCFALVEDFDAALALRILHHHQSLWKDQVSDWSEWKKGLHYSLKEFLITRASFYEIAGVAVKYEFSKRIINNGFRLLDILATC